MTTLKPQLVRADTLDLQAHDAPSAKDHTRQPAHPAPYGFGPAAPHQTQALRSAERDAHIQQRNSPRISEDHNGGSFPEEPNFYDEPDDEYDSEHAEGVNGSNGAHRDDQDMEEGDQGDVDMDDDMDDDMLDKISSSPSIDDGKYSLPIWPPRSSSVASGDTRSPASTPIQGSSLAHSSSPCTSPPDFLPLLVKKSPTRKLPSHHLGEYGGISPDQSPTLPNSPNSVDCSSSSNDVGPQAEEEPRQSSSEAADIRMYLLPEYDPLLDNSFDNGSYDSRDDDDEDSWEDEDDTADFEEGPLSSDDDSGNFTVENDPSSSRVRSSSRGIYLQEIEDIDFEFVYALHTFVATVEGQANATKGDTMVLLDDSNSYWWLVRVVKDGSIGYLPAEHIETPTERLARLNKHRNIDLSATMLGDNPEKSKNPLKKAMKRRNQKTVQFAPPTYFEPSEYDGSDDDEDEGDTSELIENDNLAHVENTSKVEQAEAAAATTAGPLAIMTDAHEPRQLTNGIKRITSNESMESDRQISPEKTRASENALTNGDSDTSSNVSRRGNVRNTDSFFKDDSVETKKISLTPRLLRGDSDVNLVQEQQDLKQRPSLETFDKIIGADEKGSKDDKKKKEKKGMLRGLFGRKEKSPKGGAASDTDEPSKVSDESLRFSPQSKDSLDSISSRTESTGLERKPSKLQKTPPPLLSPKNSPVEGRAAFSNNGTTSPQEPAAPLAPIGPAPLPPTSRPADTQPRNAPPLALSTAGSLSRETRTNATASPIEKKSMFAPITNALRSTNSTSHIEDATVSKPAYAKVAKNRFAIDDGDSDDDSTPTAEHQSHRSISPLRDSQEMTLSNRDSPMQVSPESSVEKGVAPPRQGPPALVLDTYSNRPSSVLQAPGAFPETPMESSMDEDIQIPGSDRTTSSIKDSPATDIPTPSSSRTTPTWSDASLRSYMDNDQDIRDLLIIVHDKSNVQPVGPDHPYVSNLFVNERSKLAEMQTNLDSMLTGWISRKNQGLLSR